MPAYLDYAATTPMRPVAREAWLEHAMGPGNPASLHGSGRRASEALESARETVAALAGVSAPEVIFTSGGTESNAIALHGLAAAEGRILVGATEHKAVLDAVASQRGSQTLAVDGQGRVQLDRLEAALTADVGGVALMAANNETGAVHDLAAIAEMCAAAGVAWHCDAVQWPATRDLRELAAGTVAISAHKLGGPVGVGALIVRRGSDLPVYTYGGGQEGGIRSGTVNVAGAAALAAAWAQADQERRIEARRIEELRDALQAGIVAQVPEAIINEASERLASHLSVTFPGCPADVLLMLLDAVGVEVSPGAACSAGISQPSHVLLAMGASVAAASQTLRFSLGWASTRDDVDAALAVIADAVPRSRRAGMAGSG